MKDHVFVALSTFAAIDRRPLELLEASRCPFDLNSTGARITTTDLVRQAKEATVILAGVEQYDAPTLTALPSLACISRCGVGVDSIDLQAARQRGISIANTPTIPTQAVAELALAMFLTLSRNLHEQANSMQGRRWERVTAHLLGGRTVGLLGFGRIGRRVAQLCLAFGAKVLACDPFISAGSDALPGVEIVKIDRLLAESDILSIHASRNPDHKVLIGRKELATMKRGALLVNLSRGEMVDETALVEALRSGQIAGAGLDVFPTEPYSGPLCEFPQVVLTPHSATMTVETRAEMELQCVENALSFLAGHLPPERRVL